MPHPLHQIPSPDKVNILLALYKNRRYAEAEIQTRALLNEYPDFDFGWKLLGGILQMQGKDSLAAFQQVVDLKPDDPEAHFNLGVTLKGIGQIEKAVASYQKAILLKSDYAEAHSNLGNALKDSGQPDDAVVSYHRALEIEPDSAEVHNNLGTALKDLGRFYEAIAHYRIAVSLKPDFAAAYYNLGNAQQDRGLLEDAVSSYRSAIEIKPDFYDAHNNMGTALKDLGQYESALACYLHVVKLRPGFAEAHNSLGVVLKDLGQLEAALTSFRKSLELKSEYAEAHNNLGNCLMEMGRFSEGLREQEYRWKTPEAARLRPLTQLPQWKGQKPSPKERLLVFEEQGMGDKLQFVRYLALAEKQFTGGVSFVACSPLRKLFIRSFPQVEILDAVPADQSAWHWHCPMLSLPLAFGTTLETIPKQIPYLITDKNREAFWQDKIAARGLPSSTRKIGVVWKPGAVMKTAPLRTLTLQLIKPLLNQPDCAWFSLQKEPDPDKMPWVASGQLIDWSDDFNDFDETAALAVNLDLVVSVDTSVAHLAGGLGVPIWLFNRHASEWRWMKGREDSPWYPTMRIFTQKTAGDWMEVVSRMVDKLNELPNSAR